MGKREYQSAGGFELSYDDSWDKLGDLKGLDPYIRLVVAHIEAGDFDQVFSETGVRLDGLGGKNSARLPLLFETEWADRVAYRDTLEKLNDKLVKSSGTKLEIPAAYFDPKLNPRFGHMTGQLSFGARKIDADELRATLASYLQPPLGFPFALNRRLSLPGGGQPCRVHDIGETVGAIGLPADRKINGITVTGKDVIVGIIDDGCALAHGNFLKPGTDQTRVLAMWDQTPQKTSFPAPVGFLYGREIKATDINTAIQNSKTGNKIDEKKVYAALDYDIDQVSPHGTHVMDIAVGNGASLIGNQGVANEADIVFVQLPVQSIDISGPQLYDKILDGVLYIFSVAAKNNKPAVVNISYGSYAGPHDGTSQWEKGIDSLLTVPDRAVVVAAGNGFEADCHALGTLQPQQKSSLRWITLPEDPSANTVDLWYSGNAQLELWLTPPGATNALGPIVLGDSVSIDRAGTNNVIGWAFHVADMGNNDNHIVISLNGTDVVHATTPSNCAPPGTWIVELRNVGLTPTRFDAWVERDVTHPGGALRRQSRFATGDTYPGGTLSNLAAGKLSIAVGGYNSNTQQVCRYSACGPTRPTGGGPVRRKPDVLAPAAGDFADRGVLSASALSTEPTRMNGTSAAAPHVAGLVALMFDYLNQKYGVGARHLGAQDVIDCITQGAQNAAPASAPLRPNVQQHVDPNRPYKQDDVWQDLIGDGKVDILGTMNLL